MAQAMLAKVQPLIAATGSAVSPVIRPVVRFFTRAAEKEAKAEVIAARQAAAREMTLRQAAEAKATLAEQRRARRSIDARDADGRAKKANLLLSFTRPLSADARAAEKAALAAEVAAKQEAALQMQRAQEAEAKATNAEQRRRRLSIVAKSAEAHAQTEIGEAKAAAAREAAARQQAEAATHETEQRRHRRSLDARGLEGEVGRLVREAQQAKQEAATLRAELQRAKAELQLAAATTQVRPAERKGNTKEVSPAPAPPEQGPEAEGMLGQISSRLSDVTRRFSSTLGIPEAVDEEAPAAPDAGALPRAGFEKVMGTHVTVNAAAEALKPEPVHLALMPQTGLEQRPEDGTLSA